MASLARAANRVEDTEGTAAVGLSKRTNAAVFPSISAAFRRAL